MRLLGALLIGLVLPAAAATLEGKVVAVADGDTITILDDAKVQHRIRIHGIDAPEKAQAFGQRAKENMSRLAFGMAARAECHKRDRYNREVCKVLVRPPDCLDCGPTLDVGLAQVTQGLAWHYKAYEREQLAEDRARYADAEVEARARRAGLWADKNATAPWEWRAKGKQK
jgi:endonuclease YncB( thermonuclease family)